MRSLIALTVVLRSKLFNHCRLDVRFGLEADMLSQKCRQDSFKRTQTVQARAKAVPEIALIATLTRRALHSADNSLIGKDIAPANQQAYKLYARRDYD